MKICENCKIESETVETMTLCPQCFNKLSLITEYLIIENFLLKKILEDKK